MSREDKCGPKPWFLFGSERFASIWIVFQAELAIAFGLRQCCFFQDVYQEFYSSSKVLEGVWSSLLIRFANLLPGINVIVHVKKTEYI